MATNRDFSDLLSALNVEGAEFLTYGTIPIRVLSKEDLLTNKRSVGRTQDLLDVESSLKA